MTSSEMTKALRNENELFIAVCDVIENASSLFNDDVVSLNDIDETKIVAQVG
jgi:hypothetical protein